MAPSIGSGGQYIQYRKHKSDDRTLPYAQELLGCWKFYILPKSGDQQG